MLGPRGRVIVARTFMRDAIALYSSLGSVETAQFDGSETAEAGLEGLTQYLQIALTPESG